MHIERRQLAQVNLRIHGDVYFHENKLHLFYTENDSLQAPPTSLTTANEQNSRIHAYNAFL